MVFGLIGFYEDSRTWTNVNPIGRLRQLDKILATDLNTLTLLFLSAAIIYFALQIIEKKTLTLSVTKLSTDSTVRESCSQIKASSLR